MRFLSLILVILNTSLVAQFPSNYTPTYPEIIESYQAIANENPTQAKLLTIGSTDAGLPLHYLIIDASGKFTPEKDGRLICMIMNGIHPGEACGINASIEFAKEKAKVPDPGIVYVILPVYNVGGALNRNSTSRANQVGPESYGFRGNAKNLDLNRDFIKCDSKNALTFTRLFHRWSPHVFIDTHTTNGADYQPSLTLITTFPEKLEPMQATFLKREFEPYLFNKMKEREMEMIPYVNLKGETPEEGIKAFTDLPRYSTGYTALFNTLSFTTEAHMLKPFDERVKATKAFLEVMDTFLKDRQKIIVELKTIADRNVANTKKFTTKWELSAEIDSLIFPGYEAEKLPSILSGTESLHYNRDKPYRKQIAYYAYHKPAGDFDLPRFFAIPQAWSEVIKRLEANDVRMLKLEEDTVIPVTALYANHFETSEYPYEGHYFHHNTGPTEMVANILFRKGDYLIPTDQIANRYLANTLDPKSPDSFFNWNFFDSVLMQKEYFSSYAFEKTAMEILDRDVNLRRSFERQKSIDSAFAKNLEAQLKYIYNNSVWHEDSHLRIPVYLVR